MSERKMCRFLILFLFLFVFVSIPGYAEIVSEWKFDGDAKDNVGNNHGKPKGNPAWTTDRYGNSEKALKLDGVNDCVDCGNDKSLNITDEITISAWIKLDAWKKIMEIVCKDMFRQYHMCTWNNRADIAMNISGASGSFEGQPLAEVWPFSQAWRPKLGKWYHFVGVYDGSFLRVYVDGNELGNDPATGSIARSEANLCIGGYVFIAGDSLFDRFSLFTGAIDDVRIYNNALSAAEVRKLYDEQKP